ncbi:toll/interleukin-1 receptor domain-containing protein [Shewanella ulleungensis]|nr:toll/interleukin-1 receptor domain-containing protein [Shewanella ulleungensis]
MVKALEDSQLLIVLCSPRAVASTYVADEISYFKKLGQSERIIAALIDGEPNASWDKGKQQAGFSQSDECFPIPLQFEFDSKGNQTDKHAEPIAADFRINNNGKPEQGWTSPGAYRQHLKSNSQSDNAEIDKKISAYQQQQQLMLLKIIAGILGVPLGELTQRDKAYQLALQQQKAKRLRQWLAGVAALAIMAIGAGLFAWQQQQLDVECDQRCA